MQEYILRQGRVIVKVPISKIYYITTHPIKAHTVIFVTEKENFESSNSLSKIEEESSGSLMRCHRKFLVNKEKIVGFDYDTRTIMFMNDRISDITCSRRYFTMLKNQWKKSVGEKQ